MYAQSSHTIFFFLNMFNENDVEMFGIKVGQYSSAEYAL